VRFPGGESLAELRRRVRAALAAWQPAARAHAIVLVTHATWIKLALIETSQLSPANFRHFPVPTGTLFWLPGQLPTTPKTELSASVSG
jgi:broad specificity phosphatase PhoE